MEYVLVPRALYEQLKVLLENPPMVLQMGAVPWSLSVDEAPKQAAMRGLTESHEVFPERADDVHGSTQIMDKREQAIRAAERRASDLMTQALKDAEERERAVARRKQG